MNLPITDASPEMTEISAIILNSQETKFLEETPALEDSLRSQERNKYVINDRSSAGLEELEGNINSPGLKASMLTLI